MSSIGRSIRSNLGSSIGSDVGNSIESSTGSNIGGSIRSSLGSSIGSDVGNSIEQGSPTFCGRWAKKWKNSKPFFVDCHQLVFFSHFYHFDELFLLLGIEKGP